MGIRKSAAEVLANKLALELLDDPRVTLLLDQVTSDLQGIDFENDEVTEELYYSRRCNMLHKIIALMGTELAANF